MCHKEDNNIIIFSANCCLLNFENYKPVGELYCDYNLTTNKIKKYYIRDYYCSNRGIYYNDIPIDYNTLEEISSEYEILGVDLANKDEQ